MPLHQLKLLYVTNNNISSVDGLLYYPDSDKIYYTKLTELLLDGNNILQIPNLQHYRLKYLDISRNYNITVPSENIELYISDEFRFTYNYNLNKDMLSSINFGICKLYGP